MRKEVLACVLLAGISNLAFALLCPGNFSEISVGMTLEQSAESQANTPQEWNYYVSANPAFTENVSQNSTATLKTTIAFSNGKVTNMSVNGVGLSTTAICGGSPINVGDTQDQVQAACGKPEFINRGTGSQAGTASDAKPQKDTTITYDVGGVTTSLMFTNGVFVKRVN
jgi:hypothetical protein